MAASTGNSLSLLECFQRLPDPRDPRGVRHALASLLAGAAAAVLAGARSFTAIGEWIAEAPAQVMAVLGVRRDPLSRAWQPPDESTVRRLFEQLDTEALDEAVCSWLAGRAATADTTIHSPARARRQAVAVDGKALRGARHRGGEPVHLLATFDHSNGLVLAQTDVHGKTNEITRFQHLLQRLDLDDRVVTADALHTQREHATFLIEQKRAHYVLIVKKNQPSLYAQVKRLSWKQIPVQHRERDRGHGREECRTLKAVTLTTGLLFPHAVQAMRIKRQVKRQVKDGSTGRWRTVTVYAITDLPAWQAPPADLAAWIRGHDCITSATSPTPMTTAESAPATLHAPWPACATSPSVPYA
ncbi:putative transposase YbfD/YdcC [Nonomuraea fuscirosea]|uniref:Putative transposase YbfD/YdcC n=1 Tax=Nonomuraea fuscirosea TaxID=1291556 RepID=A0A2T0MSM5_9ACTN|nr:ISAs1 family transposase [Nonomuraea fuscirosea]PRX61452.1 putative transposase YbfD/YdcC [Nonomuraea fuscirosea]